MGVCRDKAGQLHNPRDAVQIALAGGLGLGQDVHGTQPGGVHGLFQGHIQAHDALIMHGAVQKGDLASHEH